MRTRIEFTLSMPSNGAWNGKWSGEGKHYAIIRTMGAAEVAKLTENGKKTYWTHAWSDGWCAGISARAVPSGERVKKSAGFCGYDWMVDNIIARGTPYMPSQESAANGVQSEAS